MPCLRQTHNIAVTPTDALCLDTYVHSWLRAEASIARQFIFPRQ
jgi:hypothetical protein